MLLFYAIWINVKFLPALNKTLKFDLKKDDHDSFGPSRQIAAQIFFRACLHGGEGPQVGEVTPFGWGNPPVHIISQFKLITFT